jgi:hypothetical protein
VDLVGREAIESTPRAPTSIATLPSPCTASQWTCIAGLIRLHARAISATGCSVPISLFTSMIAATVVSGRQTSAKLSGEATPRSSTAAIAISQPPSRRSLAHSRTAECSIADRTRCWPRALCARAAPNRHSASLSVPPEVQ